MVQTGLLARLLPIPPPQPAFLSLSLNKPPYSDQKKKVPYSTAPCPTFSVDSIVRRIFLFFILEATPQVRTTNAFLLSRGT